MRSCTTGMRPADVWAIKSGAFDKVSLEIFRKMCIARTFEKNVAEVYDTGRIGCPVYLSVGQEAIAAALSMSFPNPNIFAQHRAHDLYLSYGGSMAELIDELLHLPSGCAGGMGGSASIHSPVIKMFGHDGLMGTQIPIAVGYTMATGKRTLAVMGDGSAEEDYILAALGFAATHRPPILFAVINNGVAVLTEIHERRSWGTASHANFGMPAEEITDDPWLIIDRVKKLNTQLPAILEIHTCRISSHAGTRSDSLRKPEWERYELVKDELSSLGLAKRVAEIESEVSKEIKDLWQQRLEVANAN